MDCLWHRSARLHSWSTILRERTHTHTQKKEKNRIEKRLSAYHWPASSENWNLLQQYSVGKSIGITTTVTGPLHSSSPHYRLRSKGMVSPTDYRTDWLDETSGYILLCYLRRIRIVHCPVSTAHNSTRLAKTKPMENDRNRSQVQTFIRNETAFGHFPGWVYHIDRLAPKARTQLHNALVKTPSFGDPG